MREKIEVQVVLPTGRNFCRKMQKWPQKNLSGGENPQPNFRQNFNKMGEKGPNFLKFLFYLKSWTIYSGRIFRLIWHMNVGTRKEKGIRVNEGTRVEEGYLRE
jgi:hypothetical protein